jgi:membrane-associated phospholipid phosphatase
MVLGGYVGLVAVANGARLVGGRGSVGLAIGHLVLLTVVITSARSRRAEWQMVGDWLPLIALPFLYWELPSAALGPAGRLFDSTVQGWDLAVFGTQPSRSLAGALPIRPLSETLHLAYLLYYGIIYLPPLLMYLDDARRGFYETMLALTTTVVLSFIAFSVFPVEGPRFAWGAPPGIPQGPIRALTLFLLERGSARGTAFPSSHVAIAMAQSLSSLRWRRGFGYGVAGTSILLAIGAVYGGFHYGVDILAGCVMGIGAWWLARGSERRAGSGAR